jgi:hypothetical protein
VRPVAGKLAWAAALNPEQAAGLIQKAIDV